MNLNEFYHQLKNCAFGIITDSDAKSISFVFNTYTHLLSMEEKDSDEDPMYYKWTLDEWSDDFYDDEVKLLNTFLFNFKVDENKFIEHTKIVFDLITDALLSVKTERELKNNDDKFIFGFCPSDYDNIDNEINWMAKINNKDNLDEFIKFRKSW